MIVELAKSGMKYEDIGKKFGLTKTCISVKLYRERLKNETK